MFLDIGLGILIAIWVSHFFGVPLTTGLLGFGVFFSLIPDIDFLVELFKHGSVGGKFVREHRELLHFPILYAPLILCVYLIFGSMWALMLGFGLLGHFLHDSVGIGWGVKWLWPISKRSFKFFSERNGAFSRRLLVSWSPQELPGVVAEHGDPHWMRNIYLRLHPIGVIEFLFFVGALIMLYFY